MNITVEGAVITLRESFLDEMDDPLELSNDSQGPYVVVVDDTGDTVLEAIAVPDINGQPGDWVVDLSMPRMGLEQRAQFVAIFSFDDAFGSKHKAKQPFFVDPAQESRDSDIVVVLGRDQRFEFGLPIEYIKPIPETPANIATHTPAKPAIPGDDLTCFLFKNNDPLYGDAGLSAAEPTSGVKVQKHIGKSTVSIPAVVGDVNRLQPLALLVEYRSFKAALPKTFTFKVWPVTPSILVAASMVEDYINKARAQNVIPELAYTTADLIQYLHRGLGLFNSIGPQLTDFTGMNMQGGILDSWITCACYYALGAQLQAEGQMAFDFSGQSVSLNVDRTPSIESALGRIESAIERIRPYKQLLAKNGVNSGDGSAGGQNMNSSNHLGTLGVINAATTRVYAGLGRGGRYGQQV